jgi:hypothetical protein
MTAERKSGIILGIITVVEAGWVLMNLQISGWRFLRYLGFAPGRQAIPPGGTRCSVISMLQPCSLRT